MLLGLSDRLPGPVAGSSADRDLPISPIRMVDFLQAADAADYPVRVLIAAHLTPKGVTHGAGGDTQLLAWHQVKRVMTAEVGEPEGVRTVVFDLVVDTEDGRWEVCRFDADPYDEAMGVARAILGAVAAERVAASVKSVAEDGISTAWFPDLESFSEAALIEARAAEK